MIIIFNLQTKIKENIQEKGKLSKRICENGQNMQLYVVGIKNIWRYNVSQLKKRKNVF